MDNIKVVRKLTLILGRHHDGEETLNSIKTEYSSKSVEELVVLA
ncbi:hypothetical protein [Psychrobacillus psychrotolerans]